MSLYDRILEEALREGIEYQPPPTRLRGEQTSELRMLKGLIYNGPGNWWTGMAFKCLQRWYPVEYERLCLEKNEGNWMFGFRGEDND